MRIQVNLGDEMLKKVDSYSKLLGVTRSSLCSMLIAQGVMAYDKGFEVIDKIGSQLGKNIINAAEEVVLDNTNLIDEQ